MKKQQLSSSYLYLSNMLLGILFFAPSFLYGGKDDYSQVNIKTISVADGIYMATGKGGNLGISVGKDGVFLIDSQFSELTPKIRQAIGKISKKPIRFMINTHWHPDHTGGNENLSRSGVIIISHRNVRYRLSQNQFIKALDRSVEASPSETLPMINFSATLTLHVNDDTMEIIHFPNAHTDGDSVVFFRKANVLHTGDILFNGMYPFIDISSGGSIQGTMDAMQAILAMINQKTKVIPGHGPLGTREDIQESYLMLETVYHRMQKKIAQNQKIEAIVSSDILDDLDPKWGRGFLKKESFIRILYDLTTRE